MHEAGLRLEAGNHEDLGGRTHGRHFTCGVPPLASPGRPGLSRPRLGFRSPRVAESIFQEIPTSGKESSSAQRCDEREPTGSLLYLLGSSGAEDLFDLALDLLEVHELSINGREAYVRNLVQVAQAVHDHLADLSARDLDTSGAPELRLDVVDDRAQPLGRDVPLLRRLLEPGEQLLRVEVLAAAILLGDVERHRFDALIRREALPALQAFTPPADRLPDLRVSGVDHLQVVVTAIRASHGLLSIPTFGCGETPGC